MVVAIRKPLLLVLVLAPVVASCTAVQRVSDRGSDAAGFLRVEVEPDDADPEVEIDENYRGRLTRWTGETIPVQPGMRRVTVMADGYMTQRFDIEFNPGEEVTLELHMERLLDEPIEDDETKSRRRTSRRR